MPRNLPLANGRLLVNFDAYYNLRDINFPHVGQVNHSHGCVSRLGVWVDGAFSWVSDEGYAAGSVYKVQRSLRLAAALFQEQPPRSEPNATLYRRSCGGWGECSWTGSSTSPTISGRRLNGSST